MGLSKTERRLRIRKRIRKISFGTDSKPRLAVFRSNKEIYAQLIDDNAVDLQTEIDDRTLLDCLLEPTRIYVKDILRLLHEVHIKGISHITGGGLIENIPRVMPKKTAAVIATKSWDMPEIFTFLQELGNIETREMYRTFNCGVGLIITVDSDDEEKTLQFLRDEGQKPWTIGKVKSSDEDKATVILEQD